MLSKLERKTIETLYFKRNLTIRMAFVISQNKNDYLYSNLKMYYDRKFK